MATRGPTPDRPGTKITVRNPNTAKWMAIQMPGRSKGTPMWVCRPLACASGRAAVAAESSPSPTRSPDRKALEKAASLLAVQTRAQDMMMDAASDGDERIAPLSSRVTDIRGYPAIVAESKRTNRGKASFVMRGELFVGLIKVRLVSSSADRAEARRNFDEFVAAMEIIDVAPGEPAPASETPTPSALGAPDRT
ncbi:MAG: hypothetical protein WBW74_27325 [Xanthobacteraceae bacterium]